MKRTVILRRCGVYLKAGGDWEPCPKPPVYRCVYTLGGDAHQYRCRAHKPARGEFTAVTPLGAS